MYKRQEPDHVKSVYPEGGWVGPTSPRTEEDIKTMSVEEIVGFLKTWRPPDNVFRESSLEGLGRVLSSVIAQDPGPFAVEAKRFQGLDPTYVRAVLSGLRDGLKQAGAFDWEPVLDLCQWVLAQPREIEGRPVKPMEADPDWGWTLSLIHISQTLEGVPADRLARSPGVCRSDLAAYRSAADGS